MSGKRTKALRREFRRLFGRPPMLIHQRGVTPGSKVKWNRFLERMRRWLPTVLFRRLPKSPPAVALAPVNEFRRFRRGTLPLPGMSRERLAA